VAHRTETEESLNAICGMAEDIARMSKNSEKMFLGLLEKEVRKSAEAMGEVQK
jgi:hypothetical protein